MTSDLVVENSSPTTSMDLITRALSSGAKIDVLERLVALHNEYTARQAKKAFYDAMSGLQSEMPVIHKTAKAEFPSKKTGGIVSYSYETFEQITEALRPLLQKYGFSYRFKYTNKDGGISVTCIVSHSQGHQEVSSLSAPPDASGTKNSIQAISSTISYLQRYLLRGCFSIAVAGEDEDGYINDNLKFYPDEHFDKNFPLWEQAISSGKKTHKAVFEKLAESKVVLKPDQIEQLNNVQPIEQQGQEIQDENN